VVIHLEGMGGVGSLLARRLERERIPFTWNDTDAAVVAWKASAGAILPLGDEESSSAYTAWQQWLAEDELLANMVTPAWFVYLSKHPPGNGKRVGVEARKRFTNGLTLSNVRSYHVDVQRLVESTRNRFARHRRQLPEGRVLVTHGFATATRYRWGWTAILEGMPVVPLRRPALYLRQGQLLRFVFPYGRGTTWMAGAGSVVQPKPRVLEAEDKVERWCKAVEPWFVASKVLQINTGWRPERPEPAAAPMLLSDLLISGTSGRTYIRPQSGSGIRLFPHIWEAVKEWL
jgi:hypothetical protein